jgi:hypothetical protein
MILKRNETLDKVWSFKTPYLAEILDKSNFDKSRITNTSLELAPIRGVHQQDNYPPNQSILFNPQFRFEFPTKMYVNNNKNTKFQIKLNPPLHNSQMYLSTGFPEPHPNFANFYINDTIAGSIIDVALKPEYKVSGKPEFYKFIHLPSIPTTVNANTIDFFKRLNDLMITELEWPAIKEKTVLPRISVIGTDPEFELILNGDVVRARDYFDDYEIGHDGAGTQLELRPNPTDNIEKLIANIKTLFEKVTKQAFAIGTAGNSVAIGSHIHFGGINYLPFPDYHFIKILDSWLYEKLAILNGAARDHFATPGAQRRKSWGFEYRSLPSGIFAHPILAKAVFKLAKCLADKWWNFEQIQMTPNNDNYLEFITPEELDLFNNAKKLKTNNSPKALKTFIANWGLKAKETYFATLIFRDDWPTLSVDSKTIKCGFGNCTIVLFGLKKPNLYSVQAKSSKIPKKVIDNICTLFENQEYIQPITKIDFKHKKEGKFEGDLLIGIPPDFRKGPNGVNYIIQKIGDILWASD